MSVYPSLAWAIWVEFLRLAWLLGLAGWEWEGNLNLAGPWNPTYILGCSSTQIKVPIATHINAGSRAACRFRDYWLCTRIGLAPSCSSPSAAAPLGDPGGKRPARLPGSGLCPSSVPAEWVVLAKHFALRLSLHLWNRDQEKSFLRGSWAQEGVQEEPCKQFPTQTLGPWVLGSQTPRCRGMFAEPGGEPR